jgi:hypothetical protein
MLSHKRIGNPEYGYPPITKSSVALTNCINRG